MAGFYHNMPPTTSDERLNTVSLASPSGFDGCSIDPHLLQLQQNYEAVASGSTMDLISTTGDVLGSSDPISHETAAGRSTSGSPTSARTTVIGYAPLGGYSDTTSTHPPHTDYDDAAYNAEVFVTQHQPVANNAATSSTSRRSSGHKTIFISCCAASCHQIFFRKDHLTQHIRNKHQGHGSVFHCPVTGCADHSLVLLDLFEHMKQPSHKRDVHFTSIKNAAEKPKCACGGLVVSGICKACGSA